jgi:hypothetical protein
MVYKYDCSCFLKYILFKNILKKYFLKNIFDINILKWFKKIKTY